MNLVGRKILVPNRNNDKHAQFKRQFERMSRLHDNGSRRTSSRGLKKPDKNPDEIQSSRFTRRTIILGAGGLGLFGLLAGKLYNLQRIEGRKYKSLAEDNRLATRFAPAIRGKIYDRSNTLLASNRQNLRVLLVPQQAENVAASLELLARTIRITKKQKQLVLRTARRQNPQIPILVTDSIRWGEFARINVLGARIPGIRTDIGWKRQYHYGEEFAHIIGHLGPPTSLQLTSHPALRLPGSLIGVSGVERGLMRNCVALQGAQNSKSMPGARISKSWRKLRQNTGKICISPLIRCCSSVSSNALRRSKRAAAVVLDVNNGDIVAMGSTPTFDPNLLTPPIDKQSWQKLKNTPHDPLSDKATRGQYPPGSTFKMVTALAGLKRASSPEKPGSDAKAIWNEKA